MDMATYFSGKYQCFISILTNVCWILYDVLYNIHNPLFIASSHKLINNNRVVQIVTNLEFNVSSRYKKLNKNVQELFLLILTAQFRAVAQYYGYRISTRLVFRITKQKIIVILVNKFTFTLTNMALLPVYSKST